MCVFFFFDKIEHRKKKRNEFKNKKREEKKKMEKILNKVHNTFNVIFDENNER